MSVPVKADQPSQPTHQHGPQCKHCNRRAKHKHVPVSWGKYENVPIDVEMAPVILELWMAGIDTVESCQECERGTAHIVFESSYHAEDFLNRITVYPDEALMHVEDDVDFVDGIPFTETIYARINRRGSDMDWNYKIQIRDYQVYGCHACDDSNDRGECDDELLGHEVPSAIMASAVIVLFPKSDLPEILSLLQRARESDLATQGEPAERPS